MKKIKQLTFLRFLAAVLVVIYHYGKETMPFNMTPIASLVSRGSIAVSFFFFLSGVVLALNYLGRPEFSKKEFYIKRFARIYPILMLAFTLTLILGMLYNNSFPKGVSVILQLFSLHAWIPSLCLEINYPSWSISVEVFFYLLFPFIIGQMNRLGQNKSMVFIIVFWLMSTLLNYCFLNFLYSPESSELSLFISCFPLWHLNTFLFGILCGNYIIRKIKLHKQVFILPRLLFVIGIITFFAILSTDNFIKPYIHNGLMSPVFFLIIAGLATDKSALTKLLENKVFVLLGNASYAIYILQFPVFICFCALFGTKNLEGYFFYIYLISLIIISIITYITFETKMKKLIIKNLI